MKKIEIKHRWTGAVLYSCDVEDNDAYPILTAMRGAYLSRANLSRAYLSGAYLSGADLSRAYLSGADLSRANLSGADLSGADLSRADLSRADLSRADLSRADLSRANLSGADLDPIRDDVRAVLDVAPAEVAGLLAKLRAGEVDGTVYEGPCSCLVGTIAKLQHCKLAELPALIQPNSSRPAERFFLGIGLGATPETNPVAAVVDDWICEWMAERGEGDFITEASH